MTVRVNKFISDTGFCSRREADALIKDGRVSINGNKPSLSTRVEEGDTVLIDGQTLRIRNVKPGTRKHVYIALNKPVGITCTTDQSVKGNIVDFVDHEQRIFPIGRLDKDSEGLILLTSNGDIVNEILRAENSKANRRPVRHPLKSCSAYHPIKSRQWWSGLHTKTAKQKPVFTKQGAVILRA